MDLIGGCSILIDWVLLRNPHQSRHYTICTNVKFSQFWEFSHQNFRNLFFVYAFSDYDLQVFQMSPKFPIEFEMIDAETCIVDRDIFHIRTLRYDVVKERWANTILCKDKLCRASLTFEAWHRSFVVGQLAGGGRKDIRYRAFADLRLQDFGI